MANVMTDSTKSAETLLNTYTHLVVRRSPLSVSNAGIVSNANLADKRSFSFDARPAQIVQARDAGVGADVGLGVGVDLGADVGLGLGLGLGTP